MAPSFEWRRALLATPPEILSGTHRLVALVLHDNMDNESVEAYPAQQTIADKAGLSVRAVSRALRDLIDRGWLERYRRPADLPGGNFVYRGVIPPADPGDHRTASRGGDQSADDLHLIEDQTNSEFSDISRRNTHIPDPEKSQDSPGQGMIEVGHQAGTGELTSAPREPVVPIMPLVNDILAMRDQGLAALLDEMSIPNAVGEDLRGVLVTLPLEVLREILRRLERTKG